VRFPPAKRNMIVKLLKLYQVVAARWAMRRCTEVGKLVRLDGRLIVANDGTMRIGDKVRLRGTQIPVELACLPGGTLEIGDGTGINSGASICAENHVSIGRNCLIGNLCLIMDTDFHDASDHNRRPDAVPIVIEDNVWLAARVTVLKGVRIGEGAVVSAGSVVVVDVPPYSLVGGVPARVIKKLDAPVGAAA